jgi:hypothetical protein
MNPSTIEIIATVFFVLAILHTFSVKRFAHWAHHFKKGSIPRTCCTFWPRPRWSLDSGRPSCSWRSRRPGLAGKGHPLHRESELYRTQIRRRGHGCRGDLVPSLPWARRFSICSRGYSDCEGALVLHRRTRDRPLLGSFITEPAAMTLLAILLKRRYFDREITKRLAYAMIGLLFVNVSIGGTPDSLRSPPVLMVAKT